MRILLIAPLVVLSAGALGNFIWIGSPGSAPACAGTLIDISVGLTHTACFQMLGSGSPTSTPDVSQIQSALGGKTLMAVVGGSSYLASPSTFWTTNAYNITSINYSNVPSVPLAVFKFNASLSTSPLQLLQLVNRLQAAGTVSLNSFGVADPNASSLTLVTSTGTVTVPSSSATALVTAYASVNLCRSDAGAPGVASGLLSLVVAQNPSCSFNFSAVDVAFPDAAVWLRRTAPLIGGSSSSTPALPNDLYTNFFTCCSGAGCTCTALTARAAASPYPVMPNVGSAAVVAFGCTETVGTCPMGSDVNPTTVLKVEQVAAWTGTATDDPLAIVANATCGSSAQPGAWISGLSYSACRVRTSLRSASGSTSMKLYSLTSNSSSPGVVVPGIPAIPSTPMNPSVLDVWNSTAAALVTKCGTQTCSSLPIVNDTWVSGSQVSYPITRSCVDLSFMCTTRRSSDSGFIALDAEASMRATQSAFGLALFGCPLSTTSQADATACCQWTLTQYICNRGVSAAICNCQGVDIACPSCGEESKKGLLGLLALLALIPIAICVAVLIWFFLKKKKTRDATAAAMDGDPAVFDPLPGEAEMGHVTDGALSHDPYQPHAALAFVPEPVLA